MKVDKNIVIVSGVRTPFDKFGGDMKAIPSIDLALEAISKVTEKVGFDKAGVQTVYYGVAVPSETGQYANSPGRQALLRAGFPPETTTLTVDRACCSSMAAVELAVKDLMLGIKDAVIACGTENQSNVPYLVSGMRFGKRLGDGRMYDPMADVAYAGWAPVSVDTDNVAKKYGVTREEMDEWSYQSHMRYFAAKEAGKFDDEIFPLTVKGPKGKEIVVDCDQSPRADTSMEKLAKLKPVYGTEAITAGNAPGLNAGASAILLMTEEKAKEYGLEPIAYIRAVSSVASEAENIPTVPAKAIQALIEDAGITQKDIDLIEINEAFAAMPLVSTKILADGDEEELKRLHSITNVNGGAVALGHPMGATGARLVLTLAYELKRRGGGIGAAALCGGLAQGQGVLLEVK